jgi:hypothetical protein
LAMRCSTLEIAWHSRFSHGEKTRTSLSALMRPLVARCGSITGNNKLFQ